MASGDITATTINVDGKDAAIFDGVDDYIDCGDDTSLNITNYVTISAWIKFSATHSDYANIAGRWENGEPSMYSIAVKSDNKIVFLSKNDGETRDATSINTYNDGNWHFVVGYMDGSNVRLNIDNGVENIVGEAYTGDVTENPTMPFKIGSWETGQYFNGSIDEVKIYNRALSADEIRNLYEQRDEIHDPFVYKTV